MAVLGKVDNLILAPGLLSKADWFIQLADIRLDSTASLLAGDKDTVRRRSNNQILRSEYHDRNRQRVDDMGILVVRTHNDISDLVIFHGFGKGIPGSKVSPVLMNLQYLDGRFSFRDGEGKRDIEKLRIAVQKILMILELNHSMGFLHH